MFLFSTCQLFSPMIKLIFKMTRKVVHLVWISVKILMILRLKLKILVLNDLISLLLIKDYSLKIILKGTNNKYILIWLI